MLRPGLSPLPRAMERRLARERGGHLSIVAFDRLGKHPAGARGAAREIFDWLMASAAEARGGAEHVSEVLRVILLVAAILTGLIVGLVTIRAVRRFWLWVVATDVV